MRSYGLPGPRSHYTRLGPSVCTRMLQQLRREKRRLEDEEMQNEEYIAGRLKRMILRYVGHPEEIDFDIEDSSAVSVSWAEQRSNRPRPEGVL